VIAAVIGGVCVIVGSFGERVNGLDVIVDRAILALFLGNAEIGVGVFLSEAGVGFK
jgi:hypothetical protein